VPGEKPPDLERRIDELLKLPAAAIRLPPEIHALYQAATVRNARVTVMRWSILAASINVSTINVSTGAFDVFTVPRPLLAMDLSFRLIISMSFLLGAWLFRLRPLAGIQQALIILPCILMVGISGIIGLLSGDHVVLERFISYGFITLLTAIMFFPIGIEYTTWMAVLALALTSGYVALAPINLWAVKCQIIAVYAGAALSLIWGRHVMNQYLLRLFLLNTRVEITERIRAAIVSLGHPNPGSPFHMVTASFGIATVAQPPLAIEWLITEADTALYRAKMAGRNRVCI
jgi:hypothetical protein